MNENSSTPTTPDNNANSSIHKVKTRVSNMILNSLSNSLTKWFSPSDRNGNLRRKRESESEIELNDASGGTVASTLTPPTKRCRNELDEIEPHPTTSTNVYSTRNFSSSTIIRTPNRRKMLGRLVNSSLYNFSDQTNTSLRNQTTKTAAASVENNEENSTDEETSASNDVMIADSNGKHLNIPPTTRPISRSSTSIRASLLPRNRLPNDDIERDVLLNGTLNGSASESEDSSSRITFTQPKYGTKRPQSSAGRLNTSLVRDDEPELQQRRSGLFGTASKRPRQVNDGLLNFSSHLQTNKSLFSNKNILNSLNNSTTSLNSLNRRQSLNTSLYGSTSALSDSQTTNTNSPFYNGRTMYGGASGYSRRAISVQRPLRVPTQIRPSSSLSTLYSSTNSLANVESMSSRPTSNTSQRIFDLLNQCTTPLADAKKMTGNVASSSPALVNQFKRFNDNDLMLNRSMRLSTPKTPYSRPGVNRKSPPISELQVPSMSQLLQMKKILQNSTEKVREVATTSKCPLNETGEYKLPENSSVDASQTKRQNKIRNKISTTRVSSKNVGEENVQKVNLPNISLPVMKDIPDINLPLAKPKTATFDVVQLTPMAEPASSSAMLAVNKTSQNTSMKDDNDPVDKSQFSFSSPTQVEMPLFATNIEPLNNFKFSEPINFDKAQSSTNALTFNLSKSKGKEITEDSRKTVAQLKNASVLEALNIPSTSTGSSTAVKSTPVQQSLSLLFKSSSNQWECSCCMIKNDDTKDKCVACETPRNKPPHNLIEKTASVPLGSFGSQFKANTNTWECSACMIPNKLDALKCIACETAKPSAIMKSVSALPRLPVPSSTDEGFKSLVAQQNTRWECTACMTRNDANRKKCQCCEQAKPGSSSDKTPFTFGSSSALAPKFSFGVTFNEKVASTVVPISKTEATVGETKPTFSFGVQPSTSKTDGLAKTFSFGDQSKAKPEEKKVDTVVPTFSFGAKPSITSNAKELTATDKIVSTPTLSGFKFGASTSVSQVKPVTTPNAEVKIKDSKSNESVFVAKTEHSFKSPTPTVSNSTPIISANLTTTTNSAICFGSPKDHKFSLFGPQTGKVDSVVNTAPSQTQATVALPTTTVNQSLGTQSAQLAGSSVPLSNTPVFAFGQTQNTIKGGFTPVPAVKEKPIFSMPDFAQSQTKSATPTLSFGSSNVTVTTAAPQTNSSTFFFGQPSATSTQLPSDSSSAPSTFGVTSNPSPSGFTFGSTSTPSQPITNAFGTQPQQLQAVSLFAPATAITSSLPTEPATSSFMFRSSNTIEATPSFGQSAVPNFGQSTVQQPFGSFGTQIPTPSPTFSATPSAFGAMTNNPAPPAFGTSPFGSTGNSTTASTFGSTENNALSAFGGVAAGFGSTSSGFGSMIHAAPSSSDEPSAKKHSPGFGSLNNAAVQKPPAFSFGDSSNSNSTKTSFAFSASVSPSFNFSGGQQQINSGQPYSFGSSTGTPSSGVFNFGSGSSETKPPNAPFQFAGSSDVTNNLFAPQPSRRKIIKARRQNR